MSKHKRDGDHLNAMGEKLELLGAVLELAHDRLQPIDSTSFLAMVTARKLLDETNDHYRRIEGAPAGGKS